MDNQLQRGFVFRQENCVGCQACTIACQIHNELPENVRFRKVDRFEVKRGDDEIDVWLTHSCMHCGNPACLMVCPAWWYWTASAAPAVASASVPAPTTPSRWTRGMAVQRSATCVWS